MLSLATMLGIASAWRRRSKGAGMLGLDLIGATETARLRAARRIIVGGMLGTAAGLVGGAYLWKKHPAGGALIGGLLVGPLLGSEIGLMSIKLEGVL